MKKTFENNDYIIEYKESVRNKNDTRHIYRTIVEPEQIQVYRSKYSTPTVNIDGIEITAENHVMDESEKKLRNFKQIFHNPFKNFNLPKKSNSCKEVNLQVNQTKRYNSKKTSNISLALTFLFLFIFYAAGTYVNKDEAGFINFAKSYYFLITPSEINNETIIKMATRSAKIFAKKENESNKNNNYEHIVYPATTIYENDKFITNVKIFTAIKKEGRTVSTKEIEYVIESKLNPEREFGLVKYHFENTVVSTKISE
jgi:hypothetical protein